MEIIGTEQNDILVGTDQNDTIEGGIGNDQLFGSGGDDLIRGGANRDLIRGGGDSLETLITVGGSDTLEGGEGNDAYFVSQSASGGTVILDEQGDNNAVYIVGGDSDLPTIFETVNLPGEQILETFADSSPWGDITLELSTPEAGIIGLERSGRDLIVDLNRDGVAETESDLTITNYFDEEGNLAPGAPLFINNLTNTEIINLFDSNSSETTENPNPDNDGERPVYRFFNTSTGVHFYTTNEIEKDALTEQDNFNFEGASYRATDPLTGDSTPVYRFLNEDTGTHLYTLEEAERNSLEETDNFTFEGEAFSAYATEIEGSIPIYRFFNTETGAHLYTPSAEERDLVEDTLPDYQAEGIAYYALPNDI